MKTSLIRGLAAAALFGLAATNATAQTAFLFELTGAQEVPSVTTTAAGVGIAVLNAAQNQLDVTVYHTVQSPTAAHIHMGAPGTVGPVFLFAFNSPLSPMTGSFFVTPTQVTDLMNGQLYINIHSLAVPTGEIRGQIVNSFPPQVFINEYCNDPYSSTTGGIDTNLDGVAATSTNQSDDEFVEIVNGTNQVIDISNWMLLDAAGGGTVRHVFAQNTFLPAAGSILVFGGGSVATLNGLGRSAVLASSGALGLNNSNDTVELRDAMGVTVDIHSYGSGTPDDGDGESVTRSPETATGTFMHHTTVAGTTHSPGTTAGGIPFETAILPGGSLPAYPGNGADCAIEVSINGVVDGNILGIHTTNPGDLVGLRFFSPGGTLTGAGFAFAIDIITTGVPAAVTTFPGDPSGTGLWLGLGSSILVFNGLPGGGSPAFPPTLVPGGYVFGGQIPLSAASGTSIMCQIIASAPGFNPVNLGISNAHELAVP